MRGTDAGRHADQMPSESHGRLIYIHKHETSNKAKPVPQGWDSGLDGERRLSSGELLLPCFEAPVGVSSPPEDSPTRTSE